MKIITEIRIPCPHCLAQIEQAVQEADPAQLATVLGVFCPDLGNTRAEFPR